jgi:hypothetical protein
MGGAAVPVGGSNGIGAPGTHPAARWRTRAANRGGAAPSLYGNYRMTWGYVVYSYLFLPAAFLGYLWLGFWAVRRITRASLPRFAKGITIVLLVAVLLALPFGDMVLGHYRLAELCKSEAGVKINRVVKLDKKFVSPEGWPRTELVPGGPGLLIAGRYAQRVTQEDMVGWPKIVKIRIEIRDETNGDVLGEVIDFGYAGGWLANQLPGHSYGNNCPDPREKRTLLQKSLFRSDNE